MRLRKLTAVSLAAAMAATAITGCGNREEKPDVQTEGKAVSAESFSDALKKSSAISSYDYSADVTFSMEADDLFGYSTEEMEQILDVIGISSDKAELKLTVDGSVKESGEQSITLGFALGNLSGDLTEIIYVNDMLYINIADAVDVITQTADMFGMKDMVSTYLMLLPEGDYIAVSKDTLTQFGEAVMKSAQMAGGEFSVSQTDVEAVEKAVYYLMDEVEKAAKKAESVYSSDGGYSIHINNSNMLSFMAAGINVLAEDKDEIIKNLQIVAGDADMDISIEDAFNQMNISTEEERKKLLEDLRSAKDEMQAFDITMSADYSGEEGSAKGSFSCDMEVSEKDTKITVSANVKITENSRVVLDAPESVMAKEDIEAILSLIGIHSPEDIADMFGNLDYGYDDSYNNDFGSGSDVTGSFDDVAA